MKEQREFIESIVNLHIKNMELGLLRDRIHDMYQEIYRLENKRYIVETEVNNLLYIVAKLEN